LLIPYLFILGFEGLALRLKACLDLGFALFSFLLLSEGFFFLLLALDRFEL